MPKSERGLTHDVEGRDILASYRERIWFLFGIVFMAIFLPGSIFILYTGFTVLAFAVMGTALIFVLNRYSPVRDRAPQLCLAAFVAAMMLLVGLSLLQRGIFGIFWAFPAVLMINFVANRGPARIYTGVFVAFIGGIALYVLELPVAARAVTGLIVTALLINIFLGSIDELQKKLLRQSVIDPLTGALNRREIDSILEDAIERKRRTNTPASLLILDLDKFKSVNDTYGHAAGDKVLRELVSLMSHRARRLDRLFRMGGEEFMLFLPDTDGIGAASMAEDLRFCVEQASLIEDRVITISIGVSELDHGETIDEWIKRGDDALFSAKDNGRNRAAGAMLPVQAAADILPPAILGNEVRLSSGWQI